MVSALAFRLRQWSRIPAKNLPVFPKMLNTSTEL